MSVTMPPQYYDRTDPAKNYEQHLFIAGRGLQSAEMNEAQKAAQNRLRGVADALFRDGDIIRDASCLVNPDTGFVQCQSGALYIRGAVRGVAPASFTIPIVGNVAIGIRLHESVITHLEDPTLLDPATGTRNYQEPGAERLQVVAVWGWDGDGESGEFFPVYSVVNGVLSAKEAPPSLDSVTQALARYDRDSAGGTYIVSGLILSQLTDVAGVQYYSLSDGRARVYGYGVEFPTARRIAHNATTDLRHIENEPHLSSTAGAQRINFDRKPGTAITEVTITAQKTVTLTHGSFTGAIDPLPDTSILSIVSVTQGVTTYASGTDYNLTAGSVDWSPGGAEPAPGSTYSVTYRYLTNVTPTAIDDDGFTVTGAIVGSLVLVTYSQKLPRYDRLCIDTDGNTVWLTGVASEYNPLQPIIPPDLLAVATVYQTWRDTRTVTNDGVYTVPMPTLSKVERRLDELTQLIAQQRLESSIHTREAGAKKGLFTDPFIDDSQRDAGTTQTAAVVNGELVLPITATVIYSPSDLTAPQSLPATLSTSLQQPLRSGNMKINPYLAFDPPPAIITLTPSLDRWTEQQTAWASPATGFWAHEPGGAMITTTEVVSRTSQAAKTLRQIPVSVRIEGFQPGEPLTSFTFDGVQVMSGTANSSGVVTGSFTIPANVAAGVKSVNAVGAAGTKGSAAFVGQGSVDVTTIRLVTSRLAPNPPRIDPLAQTFTLDTPQQVGGVELWFTTKPTTETLVQIRETATGFPTSSVIAEGRIQPSAISTTGWTRIPFSFPVSLLPGVEYAIVTLCNDSNGAVAVAELGKQDVASQRWITSQPYTVGVLLSSSNASTWTAHQDRDMAFRLLRSNYTANTRTVSIGTVAVTNATDLALLAASEIPSSQTSVDYTVTLPSGDVLVMAEGQKAQLSSAVTGNVSIAARLTGTADFSPVVYPGTQLIAGHIENTGDYVSRAVPAGSNVIVKVIYEGVVPSGATVECYYKGPDAGDTWTAVPMTSTSPADDGFVEFIRSISGVTETSVQIKLVLNGTPAARPRLRDLRVIVLENI